MPSICLNFRVHQPQWLRHYTFFDIDHDHLYEDQERNRHALNELSEKWYLPANNIILDIIREHKGDFRIAFSISGILLDHFEKYRVDVLDSFKRLSDTGCVEFVGEAYYHSLAFLFSVRDFKEQVALHKKKIQALFGQTPRTFRHTEFMYNNDLARAVENMGYTIMLAEGADEDSGWRSANYVYKPAACKKLKILLRNRRLSADIGFHFSSSKGSEDPHLADNNAPWIRTIHDKGDVINLFMDYGSFDKDHCEETGIFEFIRLLPHEVLKHRDFRFNTPAEIANTYDAVDSIACSDSGRDLSFWLGNALQKDAVNTLYSMEPKVRRRKDGAILHTWRMLQESDHLYSMHTKPISDSDVHQLQNPYGSPYDAYINFMNIMDDFSGVLSKKRSVVK